MNSFEAVYRVGAKNDRCLHTDYEHNGPCIRLSNRQTFQQHRVEI